MANNSAVDYVDATFNAWWGCQKVSPGCDHCFALAWANRTGYADCWGRYRRRFFGGTRHWREPELLDAAAQFQGVQRRVLCQTMGDVFEKPRSPILLTRMDQERSRLWALIERTPHLLWLLLTKRPENVADLVPLRWMHQHWPKHAWLGFTAESQVQYMERRSAAMQLPAPGIFVSAEPMLGPILLRLADHCWMPHWIICGSESGANARPMDLDWVRSLRDQCAAYDVPFFFKQKLDAGTKVHLPALDGRVWNQYPET